MQQTKNNYDKVAWQYDWLSRAVFYRSQVNAQVQLLKYIPAGSQVLIVGGGTGWILEKLPPGLSVTYVEISANMMTLSRKRRYQHNTVDFVNLPIEEYSTDLEFDVIITPFLFDNFAADRAQTIFWQLHYKLKKDGLWLFTDFVADAQKSRWWHKWLLKTMYAFFRLLCNVEAKTLFNMSICFEQGHYTVLQQDFYYFGFIQSLAYRKPV